MVRSKSLPALLFALIVSVMLAACGGGGSDGSSSSSGDSSSSDGSSVSASAFERITVSEVDAYLDANTTGTHIVHEDGFDKVDGTADIGRVILTRFHNDPTFEDGDIGYAFDVKYALMPSGDTVLYLDTDNNVSTGMEINGIGADVRLTDSSTSTHESGYYQWDGSLWELADGGSGSSGSANDGIPVDGGAHIYVGIHDTSSLLQSNARGVLAIETLTNDNTGTALRHDATSAFSISAF